MPPLAGLEIHGQQWLQRCRAYGAPQRRLGWPFHQDTRKPNGERHESEDAKPRQN